MFWDAKVAHDYLYNKDKKHIALFYILTYLLFL